MKKAKHRLNNYVYLPHNLLEGAVFLLCVVLYAVHDLPILLYGIQGFSLVVILKYRRKCNKSILLMWVLLLIWTLLSVFWAEDTNHAIKFIREISHCGIVCVIVSMYFTDQESIEKTISMICTASIIMIVYFCFKTPLSEWKQALYSTASAASSSDRFGRTIGMHPNSFGAICALESACWFYQWKKKHKKTYLLWAMMLIILMLFSKSRSSMLTLAMIVGAYLFFENGLNKKAISNFCVLILFCFISLFFVLNNGFLYKLVGYRIKGVLAYIIGEGTIDASVLGRETLIDAGKQIIFDHPFLGVGAGNYSNIAYANNYIWRDVFSHSNYIEIWADLGLIGIMLYYLPRFYCLYRLLKIRETRIVLKKNQLCIFCLALMIAFLVSDYFKLRYDSETSQIMIMMCMTYKIYSA